MSDMQDALKAALHDHVFRTGTMTKPTEVWLGLFTTPPAKDGTGGTEVSTVDTGYGRVQCGPLDANWDTPDAAGKSVSLVDFTFAQPTGAWGEVTHWGVFTAETAGTCWSVTELTASKTIDENDLPPKFSAGDLSLTWL